MIKYVLKYCMRVRYCWLASVCDRYRRRLNQLSSAALFKSSESHCTALYVLAALHGQLKKGRPKTKQVEQQTRK